MARRKTEPALVEALPTTPIEENPMPDNSTTETINESPVEFIDEADASDTTPATGESAEAAPGVPAKKARKVPVDRAAPVHYVVFQILDEDGNPITIAKSRIKILGAGTVGGVGGSQLFRCQRQEGAVTFLVEKSDVTTQING